MNSSNENILVTEPARFIASEIKRDRGRKEWFADIQRYFYLCIDKCQDNFETIERYVPSELGFRDEISSFVSAFLFNKERNKLVITEFLSRLL